MQSIPTLFCPRCQTYLGSYTQVCLCGWERSDHERLPEPGQPLWSARLEGVVHGALVAGDLVIFHYGDRNAKGGVCAFHRGTGKRSWSFETSHSVKAGIVHFEACLFFATCGFLGSGAALYCLELDTGQLRWKQPIGAGVWSKPVVEEARLYIAQEDGTIRGFDNRQGAPLSHEYMSLPRGQVWLEKVDHTIIALSRSGQILFLNPQGLNSLWNKPLDVGCEITSAPCKAGKKLFFGGRDGQVIELDISTRKHSVFASGLDRVVAAPAYSRERLFVGAHDHHLHAFDVYTEKAWKSPAFEHSLSSAPFVGDGLVVAGVNQSGVALLDASSGELAWHFPVGKDVKLLSDPVLADGVIYVGTDTGQVLALPWHLGKYKWAAGWLERANRWSEAALFYAVSAHNAISLDVRESLYRNAETCWDAIGQSESAARMWEGLAHEKRAADAYCRAAESRRGRDNRQAAEYYYSASRLYWRVEGMAAQADQCAREAAKLGRWPDIRLKARNNPKMTQGKTGMISFRAENIGYGPARNLFFTLGGSLSKPAECRIATPLQKDSYYEITLEIVPTKATDSLMVEAEYGSDETRQIPFSSQLSMTIEAGPPAHKIKAGDSVMGKLKIVNPNNEPIEVEIGDRVGTEVEIVLG